MRRQLLKLGRVVSLTSSERTDLLRAQWAIMVARLQYRTRATGSFVRRPVEATRASGENFDRSSVCDVAPEWMPGPPDQARRARALEVAVRRAAEHGPVRTTCLLRATALQQLLERDGIQGSRLRVGVRRSGEHFAAHAWLELGDMVLGDQPQRVRTFTPTDLRLVRR